MSDLRTICFDGGRLRIEDVVALARGEGRPVLSGDPAFRARIARGAEFLERLLREDGVIYGVTTGYGDSSRCRCPRTSCRSCRASSIPTTVAAWAPIWMRTRPAPSWPRA